LIPLIARLQKELIDAASRSGLLVSISFQRIDVRKRASANSYLAHRNEEGQVDVTIAADPTPAGDDVKTTKWNALLTMSTLLLQWDPDKTLHSHVIRGWASGCGMTQHEFDLWVRSQLTEGTIQHIKHGVYKKMSVLESGS
jgi:hypothetical protein